MFGSFIVIVFIVLFMSCHCVLSSSVMLFVAGGVLGGLYSYGDLAMISPTMISDEIKP